MGLETTPAVVVSSDIAGLAVIRALGTMGVPVVAAYYDRAEVGHSSRYARQAFRCPHPEHEEESFLGFLFELAERYRRPVLIPTADETITALSRNKARLEPRYLVACADWDTAMRFIDKSHTYALADRLGVPAPRTFTPRSAADLERCARTVGYPCLVKPSQSHRYTALFNRKMVKARDLRELTDAYREATEHGLEMLVQEFIPGDDSHGVNYNAYMVNGQPVAEATAEKVRLSPPEIGAPRVVLSKRVPEVAAPARALLQGLGVDGFACTEFKRDARDGSFRLMEVNGRHNLSTALSVRSGVNFPWIMYRHLVHGVLPSPVAQEEGIYWIDESSDLFRSLRHAKEERYSARQLLRPYLQPHVFSVLSTSDPAPFVTKSARLGAKALRELAALMSPHPASPVGRSAERGLATSPGAGPSAAAPATAAPAAATDDHPRRGSRFERRRRFGRPLSGSRRT